MKHRIAIAAAIAAAAAIVGPIGPCAAKPAQAQQRAASARAPAAMTPDEALVAAREAFVRNDLARFDAAAAQAREHPLAEYLDFWRLRMRLQAPDPGAVSGGADDDIRAFLARHDGTLVADLLRRDWLANLGKRAAWNAFDEQYPGWVLRDDDDVHCYAWLGQVQRGQPAPPEARATLFSVRSFGEGCAALLEAQAKSGALSRADLSERLREALEDNSTDAVRRVAAQLSLDAAAVDAALSRPSRSLTANSGRELTLIAFSRLARDDPQAAATRLKADPTPLGRAEQAFVWSQIAASGMRRLAPESLDWARRALAAPAGDATWAWLARAALRAQDWPTLRAVVERMSEDGRRDPAWTYWLARALRGAGEAARADALLEGIAGQYGFYGQLATEELGRRVALPERAATPSAEELAEPARNPGFARALRFYGLGLRVEGNREWNFQLRGMNDRQLLAAAEWACRRGVLDRCVNTADRTRSEHDFRLRYVSPFQAELEPVAAERGLDPAWVYGLIRQESRFIMDARSWAGAQGLMQIMPATARWIARKLGERDFRVEQLHDLPTNLRFGTYYLRSVLDNLDGSPVLASAAYNAGPGRPRSWRATLPQRVEGAIFAEIIPFTETRDYVKKVLANANVYATLFSGEPQSLKARLGSVSPLPDTPVDDLP